MTADASPMTADASLAMKLLDLADRVQRANVEYTAAVGPVVSCELTERDRLALITKSGLSTAGAALTKLAEMFGRDGER